ncbi:MAG: hypothetical protein IVW53_11970 [Chloroflexi bacterium]|nr:hypothetical protein [Chloroflexota bacterium]
MTASLGGRHVLRRGGVVVAAAVAGVILAACSGGGTPTGASVPSPSSAVSAPAVTSPVTGIITNVRSAGLDKVEGFTLRTADGTTISFVIGRLDDPAQFPPGHLAEHQASLQRVVVSFTVVDGQFVVYHLADG